MATNRRGRGLPTRHGPVPVVPTAARSGEGLEELLAEDPSFLGEEWLALSPWVDVHDIHRSESYLGPGD